MFALIKLTCLLVILWIGFDFADRIGKAAGEMWARWKMERELKKASSFKDMTRRV